MIVIFAVFGAGLWIEQIVSGDEFENLPGSSEMLFPEAPLPRAYHGRHAPDIRTGTPFCAQDDLWRSVLPGLDVVREMVCDPARVSQIGNFDRDDLTDRIVLIGRRFDDFFGGRVVVEGDFGKILLQGITVFGSSRPKR